jgi:hypothetical protein
VHLVNLNRLQQVARAWRQVHLPAGQHVQELPAAACGDLMMCATLILYALFVAAVLLFPRLAQFIGAVVLVLVLIAVARAEPAAAQRLTSAAPPQFDVPYTGNLTIWYARSERDLRNIATPRDANWGGVAYASHNRKEAGTPATVCNVYILDEKIMKARGWSFNLVLRHELGHCNGWQGHDGGRKVPISTPTSAPQLPESTRWLPAYPPLVCITSDRTVEPCDQRRPWWAS